MLPTTEAPFPSYFDFDGDPLDSGYIYYGLINQNPVTAPLPIFWDAAGTQPATQPIRTSDGNTVRSGAPANIFVNTAYSISVYDKRMRLIYTLPDSTQYSAKLYNAGNSGSVTRSVSSKLSDFVSVKDFGAVGDGVTDDTAAIQAAINHSATFNTSFGQGIYFPRGDYLYSALSISTSAVKLFGFGDARLIKSTTTGNGLSIVGASGRIYAVSIKGLVFSAKTQATAGALVYIQNAGQIVVEELTFTSYPAAGWNGLQTSNVAQIQVLNLQLQNCRNTGLLMADTSDVFMSNSRSDANELCGMNFDTCAGVYVTNVACFGNKLHAFHINASVVSPIIVTDGPSYQFFVNCIGDTSGFHNWNINNLRFSVFTGCWGATQLLATTAEQAGFAVNNCDECDFDGCIGINNNGAGIVVTGTLTTAIQIRGGKYVGNGRSATSTSRSGVHVAGVAVEVTMANVIMRAGAFLGNQQYGLDVGAGVTKLIITGCDMTGNLAAPYLFTAQPTIFIEDDNITGESIAVASASSMQVPQFGKVFVISGTTTINAITAFWPRRQLQLIFQGALTVVDGAPLHLNSNLVTAGGTTLSLVSDGTFWYETARSVN